MPKRDQEIDTYVCIDCNRLIGFWWGNKEIKSWENPDYHATHTGWKLLYSRRTCRNDETEICGSIF